MIRQMIKSILPEPLVRYVRGRRIQRHNRSFKDLPLETTWDAIYERQAAHTAELSGKGSYGAIADEYVQFVASFIKDHEIETITDIGCGDFNVGRRIAPLVGRYVAMDVSAKIIERNRSLFAEHSNVEFLHRNACTDRVPSSQLVTIRQVLQHLTNAEIQAVLNNVQFARPHFALIAEHCRSLSEVKEKNVDLGSHGYHTRALLSSGVYIADPPFSLPATVVKEIPLRMGANEYLYVWLWEVTANARRE